MEYTRKHLFVCPEESIQQLLEGILEHFFPPNSGYIGQNVSWFLNQLILGPSGTVFSQQPATIRYLKLYLARILTCETVESSSPDTLTNPLCLFDDKVIIIVI